MSQQISPSAQVAREQARDPSGRFGAQQATEPEVDLDAGDRTTGPGHWTGRSFTATVQPQFWRGDYAMDAGPPEDFDIAPHLHDMDAGEREYLLSEVEDNGAADLDHLYESAAAAGRAEPGHGPFEVSVDADRLREWMEDNPPWTQDGTTPHPSGGYVTVETDVDEGRESVTRYLDADGKMHNESGPALVKEDDTGVMERHYRHGVLHNENGPAVTTEGLTGSSQAWYVEGQKAGSVVTISEPGWEIVDGRPRRTSD